MSDLPSVRLDPSAPFTYCGIDCFGPFTVTEGRKQVKRYGLMVTCLASRAVHIDVVYDMSTDSFLNALRRLIAFRGAIRQIRCDNGTNFVGGYNELSRAFAEMEHGRIKNELLKDRCDFVFNTPYSSHKGGVWERQIRSARDILTNLIVKTTRLTTDSFQTLLMEAMSIINSRPLSTQGLEDGTGPLPLSPNTLLTHKSNVVAPPPGKFEDPDLYGRKQWRKVQHLVNCFWKRWRTEFLSTLQPRKVWQGVRTQLAVGDVVIVHENHTMRTEWPLAVVTQTHPGTDGLIRTISLRLGRVDLKSPHNLVKRSIHQVTFLTR